jgi:peptide deformylase
MILPIVAYGDPVLKREADDIQKDHPELDVLIDNMFETMYAAQGVGLAAPQIGESIRLFIVDASPFADDTDDPEALKVKDFKEVFINARIVERDGDEWPFAEGCLSIPNIREDVMREEHITIQYYDQNWIFQEKTYDGYVARIIQHEYDHIDGILFIDRLKPLKKKLLKRRLQDISRGEIEVKYRMRFPLLKTKR